MNLQLPKKPNNLFPSKGLDLFSNASNIVKMHKKIQLYLAIWEDQN